MNLNNYNMIGADFWQGRIDDPGDPDSFRMHQAVQRLDLLKLSELKIDKTKPNFCLLGFCCDEGVKRNLGRTGAANGPENIRLEFANLPVNFGNKANLFDAGNIYCVDDKMEEAQEELSNAVELMLSQNLIPLIMGGGHETALGHYSGISKFLSGKKSPAIINFDAHLDMRPYDNGGSSGTMFYQIADKCREENRLFNYLCLGTQTYGNTISLFKRAESFGAAYVHAKDIIKANYELVSEKINLFSEKSDTIYVTICADVFNSANAPGVSATQPFGMDPEVVLYFLKQVLKTNKVISLDICEVSPRFDDDNRTAKLAAVIYYSVINTMIEAKENS